MDERGATLFCDMGLNGTAETAESGPPAAQYLIVLRGGVPGRMIRLGSGPQGIGRGSENALQIADMNVSRQHANLLVDQDGRVWLTDLASTNGTYLNGQRIGPHQTVGLRDGDRIAFGPVSVLKYVRPDALDEGHHREMYERSVRDPLTGLYNRAYFQGQAELLAHQSYRRDLGLAVLLLDIDRFKQVNDTHGHDAGDAVLREVAAVLRHLTRADDVVARYGGEEFVAALPIATRTLALERADRMRRCLASRSIDAGGAHVAVTASIGLAFATPDLPRSLQHLVSDADAALYRAKQAGRDRVVAFDEPARRTSSGNPDAPPRATAGGLTTVDFEAVRV